VTPNTKDLETCKNPKAMQGYIKKNCGSQVETHQELEKILQKNCASQVKTHQPFNNDHLDTWKDVTKNLWVLCGDPLSTQQQPPIYLRKCSKKILSPMSRPLNIQW
jgi:hypothetical protein